MNATTKLLALAAFLMFPCLAWTASSQFLAKEPYRLVSISPDGKNIAAYIDGEDNYKRIMVFDTAEFKPTRVKVSDGKGGEASVNDLRWVNNNTLVLLSQGEGSDQWLHTYQIGERSPDRLAKEGNRTIVATPTDTNSFYVAERISEGDSQKCRLLRYKGRGEAEPEVIYSAVSKTFDCVVDHKGTLKLIKKDDGDAAGSNLAWYRLDGETGSETKLNGLQFWHQIQGVAQGSNKVIVSAHINTANPAIYVYDIEKDTVEQALAENPTYSLETYGKTVFDPLNGKVLGLHLDSVERRTFWSDSQMADLQAMVDAELGQTINRIVGWSSYRESLLVERFIPSLPTQYLYVDVTKKSFSPVLLNGPSVEPGSAGTSKFFEYANRDGATVSAILTLPLDFKPGEPRPLVVWLRQGLWNDLDRPEWHPEANYFASDGYVVLRINYSGSQGLLGSLSTDKSTVAGVRKTFDDIEDGIQTLVQAGLVDPKKVVIGGEAEAAWGAAYAPIASPGKYQAVLALNGVYDLVEYNEDAKSEDGLQMNAGLNFNFANADSKLSAKEIESLSVNQNLSKTYAKYCMLSLGDWAPQEYKNHVQAFMKDLKKAKVTVRLESGSWWGSQMNGGARYEVFKRALALAKTATK